MINLHLTFSFIYKHKTIVKYEQKTKNLKKCIVSISIITKKFNFLSYYVSFLYYII